MKIIQDNTEINFLESYTYDKKSSKKKLKVVSFLTIKKNTNFLNNQKYVTSKKEKQNLNTLFLLFFQIVFTILSSIPIFILTIILTSIFIYIISFILNFFYINIWNYSIVIFFMTFIFLEVLLFKLFKNSNKDLVKFFVISFNGYNYPFINLKNNFWIRKYKNKVFIYDKKYKNK